MTHQGRTQDRNLPIVTEKESLEQRFSIFVMLQPFDIVPHVVVTTTPKIIFIAFSLL